MSSLTQILSQSGLTEAYNDTSTKSGEAAHFDILEVNSFIVMAPDMKSRAERLGLMLQLNTQASPDGIRLFDSHSAGYLTRLSCIPDRECNLEADLYFWKSSWAAQQLSNKGWQLTGPDGNGTVALTGAKDAVEFTNNASLLVFGFDFPSSSPLAAANEFVAFQEVTKQGVLTIYFLDPDRGDFYTYDGKKLIPLDLNTLPMETPEAWQMSSNAPLPQIDLPKSLRTTQGEANNFVLSSYSVLDALTMLFAGLSESDYQRVAAQFNLSPNLRTELAEAQEVRASLMSTEGVDVTVAGAAYGAPGFFKPDYEKRMEAAFGEGTVTQVNFAANPEAARKAINAFVKAETNGLIPELLAPGKIDEDTLFCLVNALYFKGEWAKKFDANLTRTETFYSPEGPVQAPLMHQRNQVRYYENRDFQAIALPYKGGNMSMVVVLPQPDSHFEPTHDFYNDNLLWQASSQNVDITLPRFKVQTTIELDALIAQMGLTGLDYSGMTDRPQDMRNLQGVTQAVFKVDEFGAEGAAATAVTGSKGLGASSNVKTFRADRPFYFAVLDHTTGTILFEGQVSDPTE